MATNRLILLHRVFGSLVIVRGNHPRSAINPLSRLNCWIRTRCHSSTFFCPSLTELGNDGHPVQWLPKYKPDMDQRVGACRRKASGRPRPGGAGLPDRWPSLKAVPHHWPYPCAWRSPTRSLPTLPTHRRPVSKKLWCVQNRQIEALTTKFLMQRAGVRHFSDAGSRGWVRSNADCCAQALDS